jgi:hypothetical protein
MEDEEYDAAITYLISLDKYKRGRIPETIKSSLHQKHPDKEKQDRTFRKNWARKISRSYQILNVENSTSNTLTLVHYPVSRESNKGMI